MWRVEGAIRKIVEPFGFLMNFREVLDSPEEFPPVRARVWSKPGIIPPSVIQVSLSGWEVRVKVEVVGGGGCITYADMVKQGRTKQGLLPDEVATAHGRHPSAAKERRTATKVVLPEEGLPSIGEFQAEDPSSPGEIPILTASPETVRPATSAPDHVAFCRSDVVGARRTLSAPDQGVQTIKAVVVGADGKARSIQSSSYNTPAKEGLSPAVTGTDQEAEEWMEEEELSSEVGASSAHEDLEESTAESPREDRLLPTDLLTEGASASVERVVAPIPAIHSRFNGGQFNPSEERHEEDLIFDEGPDLQGSPGCALGNGAGKKMDSNIDADNETSYLEASLQQVLREWESPQLSSFCELLQRREVTDGSHDRVLWWPSLHKSFSTKLAYRNKVVLKAQRFYFENLWQLASQFIREWGVHLAGARVVRFERNRLVLEE
ncbi:hypothetical protein QJS10_CPB04g01364 [Acorus calamus]|uniref:Uncharacterized protein n=1 Tax=Acorus calamus TaxID=4465 RepID=A0AAV9F1D5_ACOCL|nr:hypothetical protein QJS10_CPB04g01364 [Acorus calamus]